ncbi:MipA/OmpV family protein [Sphingomonas sp.]|uniref:MipA/OmpV family protein n=1 Tax=Sphingomonas sp. TaxID=28214 RepID=UPI003B3B79F2
MLRYPGLIVLGGLALLAAPGAAQQTLGDTIPRAAPDTPAAVEQGGATGFIGLGAALTPRYEGADRYQASPFLIATVDWKGLEFQLRGLRARVDLFGESPFMLGPAIGTRGNRNRADTRAPLDGLDAIDRPVEVGGFVGYRFGGNARGQGEIGVDLTVLKDVADAHDGVVATGQISYALLRAGRVFADIDGQISWADGHYMRTYFGITPDEAARTGLRATRPGDGLRDVGAGVTAGFQFSRRWGVLGRIGATRYVGDARDSPIVEDGSRTQITGGVGLTFRF